MRYLPLALFAGCSEVPNECEPQLERTEQVCESAQVVGTHDNAELYHAVDDLKECIGHSVRVVCSDPGLFTDNILTVE